jgi:Cu2+-containing amine oxidase
MVSDRLPEVLPRPRGGAERDPVTPHPVAREAVVICWSRDDGKVYKARVGLADERVLTWEHQPDGQPNMTVDEFHECDAALRLDPRCPCGEFVVQSERDRGLPVWTAQNRSIENTDVVLCYVFGVHHITRRKNGRPQPRPRRATHRRPL